MKIKFLGSAKEVGRAATAIKNEKTQLLLDYGVMLNHEPGFPMHIPPKEVDAIILTHSHLDHSGAIPIFHIQENKPVYGTRLCFDLANLLIRDFIHLSSYYLPFEYLELRSMMKNCAHLDYGEKQTMGDIQFRLLQSGHIPGGAQALVEADGKRLVYTSDYNTVDTRLLRNWAGSEGLADTLNVVEEENKAIPLPDGSMDIVLILFRLHKDDSEWILGESRRIVRENGRVIVFDLLDLGMDFRNEFYGNVLPGHSSVGVDIDVLRSSLKENGLRVIQEKAEKGLVYIIAERFC